MKHVQIFEDFKQGLMAKPQGFLSRLAQGAKHAMGMESKDDRKSIESIHTAIKDSHKYNWIKNVREIKPGVIVAQVADKSLMVDANTPEIMYKGKELDLHNLQDEADRLYTILVRRKTEM
jgi:hypothetical protein